MSAKVKQLHEELGRKDRVLEVVAAVLKAPQNRYGKLEFYTEEARAAREELRLLAVEYNVGRADTVIEQAAKVVRAVLGRYQ